MRRVYVSVASLAVAAALLSAGSARAQSTAGGISTQIQVGGRAEGLGRSYTALADDATASWWNPAGLGFLANNNLSMMHTQLVPNLASDVFFEYLSFTHHYEGWGGLGLSLAYLSYGVNQATDENGTVIKEFTSYEVVPAVTYGTKLTPNVGLGVGLKYISVNLAPNDVLPSGGGGAGHSFAADMGVLAHVREKQSKMLPKINLAAVLVNLGPNIAFIDQTQSDPLARTLRLGVGGQLYNAAPVTVNMSFDYNYSLISGNDVIFGGGLELNYNNLFSLRGGYYDDKTGTIQDMTYGVGITPIANVRFDYASVPQSKFLTENNRVSKFSLTAAF